MGTQIFQSLSCIPFFTTQAWFNINLSNYE
jgi:hypothetical protein